MVTREHRFSMIVDLDAPIIPGKSAGGILIGSDLRGLLGEVAPEENSTCLLHDFGPLKVWSLRGVINQVGVYFGYRGTIGETIRIGSTVAEVEKLFGCKVEEDDEDNLVVLGSPGWCFETEQWTGNHSIDKNLESRITGIFVFNIQESRAVDDDFLRLMKKLYYE